MKVLVVDDDNTTRRLLSIYLKGSGFEVITAENGLDAIEKIGMNNVNLVITDLNMPYMDGIELVKSLRADPAWSHIPILMVTTEADPEEQNKALAAGANGYITKPVGSDIVAREIRQILKDIMDKGGALNA